MVLSQTSMVNLALPSSVFAVTVVLPLPIARMVTWLLSLMVETVLVRMSVS